MIKPTTNTNQKMMGSAKRWAQEPSHWLRMHQFSMNPETHKQQSRNQSSIRKRDLLWYRLMKSLRTLNRRKVNKTQRSSHKKIQTFQKAMNLKKIRIKKTVELRVLSFLNMLHKSSLLLVNLNINNKKSGILGLTKFQKGTKYPLDEVNHRAW